MTDVALGIDVGTSGVRIAACDRGGGVRALSSVGMAAPLNGKQDAQVWWQAVGQALQQIDLKDFRVVAIAIDGTSGTVLPVDAKGAPTALASMYNDVADADVVAQIGRIAPAETAAHGATSPLARAFKMQAGADRILHQADWLLGQFCGRFDVSDENNALKTGYDPVLRRWPDWVDAVGVANNLLPQVYPVGTRVAKILPDVARMFGLPDDVAVVTGTTDGCAAFLASGAAEAGDGTTSLGTTLTLKLLSSTPVFAPQYGVYSHRVGDQWLAGGASNSGGGVLKQFFTGEELEHLMALIDVTTPTGLSYYPLLKTGERFPINDPAHAPRMLPRPREDHVFLQALLEGIAGIEALGYRRLAELGASPLRSIRSSGGGAANRVWTELRLTLLGVPALPSASEHAAAGTARLAWWGMG